MLSQFTAILDEDGEWITTVYSEQQAAEWNRRLLEAGVGVLEMNRRLPALEDLFLELTGGESID
ncbi:hypothetical protein D3C80_2002360 [compost metagenome]